MYGMYSAGFPGATPHRSQTPSELGEIEALTPSQPLTAKDRQALHDEVLDEVRDLPDAEVINREVEEFRHHELSQWPETSYQSPGEVDESYGQMAITRRAIQGAPERSNFTRKPPEPGL